MPFQSRLSNLVLGSLLLSFLLTTALTAIATPAGTTDGGALFSPAAGGRTWTDSGIDRIQYVKANLDLLNGITVGESLDLNLFPDLILRAAIDQIALEPAAASSWIGHIVGLYPSLVTFVVWKGQLAGNVALPDAFYQIRYASDELYAVSQLDQSTFPSEMEPIPVDQPTDSVPRAPGASEADDGSTIDVLVVYTGAARLAAGGTAEIETEINLAVAETNASYSNSLINQRVRLAHMEEVALDESDLDWGTTLARLADPIDGVLDQVHTLRDAFCADNVVLIVADNQYCGLAYLMVSVSSAFESSAFSLVSLPCAAGYYSFGHELGHNMSAHHDWFVFANDDTDPYLYNHGFVNVDAGWRTIMAYNNECDSHGITCDRLPYWSNPNISYGGDPMGVPPGTSTACLEGDLDHPDCDAQNQLVLNNTAFTVANFRPSASCAKGPLLFHSYLADDDEGGDSNGNGDGIVDCGETVELYVDLYNHGDDSISGISASISTADNILSGNTISDYPAISSQATGTNKDDFELEIDDTLPNGHTFTFGLNITATGGGPWSDSFNLSVSCCSTPGTPTLTAPDDNTLVKNPIPDFQWGETSNSSEYRIEIATDPSFSELFLNETTPFPSYTPNTALHNDIYYWRVAGRNTSDDCDLQGDYSDTRLITIHAIKIYLPLLMR